VDHLTALRVFRQVVELNGFAAAARKLAMSPAAVSKNIGELEAHLGTRLLHRTTRRLSLTEAGAQYYGQIARILDDLATADCAMNPRRSEPAGTLRVSAPMSLTLTRLSASIPTFLDRYPALSLDLHLDDRRIDLVKEGFDVALRGSDRLEDSSLVARKLTSLRHVVCAAPAYFERRGLPASPDALRDHDFVQFSLSGHANEWTFHRDGVEIAVPVVGRYKVTSSLAVRDALRAGFGLSLIPLAYVQDDIERGTLATALDDWSTVQTHLYAVYPSRRHLDPKVRAFVDFLVASLAAPDITA
jgi:DNA-binding transcriptional LysR family regulator